MQNVLIPTDFSTNALKAAEYAITLFGNNAKYTLLNSYEVPHSGATMLISIADILEKDSIHLLNEEKKHLELRFPELQHGISVSAKMGAPTVAIKKVVESTGVDIVVMGTKGATGLKGILVGSVASNTISDVLCPVLAVPESVSTSLPKKILFAADDKCLNEGKLPDGLTEIANMFDAEVMVLNVVPKGELGHVGNSENSNSKPMGVFEGVNYSVHFIEDEDVNNGIESFMKNHQVDLLAMVTRRNDLFGKLFGLSNTKNMMMHSEVPLAAFH